MCHFMLPTSVDATWTLNMFPTRLPVKYSATLFSCLKTKQKMQKIHVSNPWYYTLYVFVLLKCSFLHLSLCLGKLWSWQVNDIPVSDRAWFMETVQYRHPSETLQYCTFSLFLPACYSPPPPSSLDLYSSNWGSEATLEHALFSSLESAPVTAVKSQASACS